MKKQGILLGAGVVVIVLLGLVYYAFFSESESASGDISEAVVGIDVETAEVGTNAVLLTIDSSQTTATFTIAEVLRGADFVVVGTTDQVGGQLLFDPNNLRGYRNRGNRDQRPYLCHRQRYAQQRDQQPDFVYR